jgi:hypothetical protein
MTNLSTILGSGWSNTSATGLDSKGDIIGYGTVNGLDESFLLLDTTTAAGVSHFTESPIHHILSGSSLAAHS